MIGKLIAAAGIAAALSAVGGAGFVTVTHNLRPAPEEHRTPFLGLPVPFLDHLEQGIPMICKPEPVAAVEAAPEPVVPKVIAKPVAPAQSVPRKR